MQTRIDEIADRIYRLSTFLPEVAGIGLSFNQFLIDADDPLLFHCGQRALFDSVKAAAQRVIDPRRLRWITFSHTEADECGSLNRWLAAAPRAIPAHGLTGCNIWLADAADRPPQVLADGARVELGGRTVRRLETPHLPHGWDAGMLFEESTGTLFCSDLFTQGGDGPALTREDIVEGAIAVEKMVPFTSLTPGAAPAVRRLAALRPRTLAIMHGPAFAGDCGAALSALADFYAQRLSESAGG